MTTIRRVPTLAAGALRFLEVLRATIVHSIRQETGRRSLGLLAALLKPLLMLGFFYALFTLTGARGITIRGPLVTFLLTGIFCFLIHVGTIQKVASAVRRSRAMLHHAPASIFLYVMANAVAALYLHAAAALLVMAIAELGGLGLEIRDPAGLLVPYLLSWASGLGVGMMLMALGQVAPATADVATLLYTRVQFFISGKFWAANAMPFFFPGWLREAALANPLLHIIDQMRGAAFVNYFPKLTSLAYPAGFTLAVLILGFVAQAWVERTWSASRGRR